MSWLLLPLALLLGWREWHCRKQMKAFGQPPGSAARLAYDLCTLGAVLLLLQPSTLLPQKQSRQDISLAVAIDVSPSMGLTDNGESRIELARQELLVLISALPHARIALVPFAGEPVVQVPLTADHEALNFFLSALEPGQVSAPGTAPEEAALLGQQLLKGLSGETAVLLISDGERTLPTPAPRLSSDIPVFTLLPGSLEPQPVPGKMVAGQPARSQPDLVRLQEIAEKTGGQMLQASADALAVDTLLSQWQPGGEPSRHENLWLALALALLLVRYILTGRQRQSLGIATAFGLLALLACQQQEQQPTGQMLFDQALTMSPGEDSSELFGQAADLLDNQSAAIALHNACRDALEKGLPERARQTCEQALLIRSDLPGTGSNLSLALRQLQNMPPGTGETEQPGQPKTDGDGEELSAAQARRMVRDIRISPFAAENENERQAIELQVERDW